MPKYEVTKLVDAYVPYTAIVNARDADEAIKVARLHEEDLTWEAQDAREFDDTEWPREEVEKVVTDISLDSDEMATLHLCLNAVKDDVTDADKRNLRRILSKLEP